MIEAGQIADAIDAPPPAEKRRIVECPKACALGESDALTTLCIAAGIEGLDRDLPAQLREVTDVHAKAARSIQAPKHELATADKAGRAHTYAIYSANWLSFEM